MIFTAPFASPVGELWLAVDERGRLVRIDFPVRGRRAPAQALGPVDRARCAHVAKQLREYFAGERTGFDLALAPEGTDFQLAAWRVLRRIPYGGTATYQEQATRIGRPTAARAVGAANGRNPIPVVVPCHRVIGKDGTLTGFGGGLSCKQWLLDHEQRVLAAKRPRAATAAAAAASGAMA